MSETGESFLQRKTGANLDRWKGRAVEFAKNPNRREAMRKKLLTLVRSKLGKENARSIEETILDVETHESGLVNYFYHFPDYKPSAVAISQFPRGVKVGELVFPQSVYSTDLAKELEHKDQRFHFIVTGNVARFIPGKEEPIIGLSRNGQELKPFVVENNKDPMKEQENGGIAFNGSDFEILPFSQIEKASKTAEIAEQTLFVANNTNGLDIGRLPQYSEPNYINFIGYFLDQDNSKTYFAGLSHGSVSLAMEAIEKTAQRGGFSHWEMACLDNGGTFAGMADSTTPDIIVGASLSHKVGEQIPNHIIDPGHPRQRFYEFTWPKSSNE